MQSSLVLALRKRFATSIESTNRYKLSATRREKVWKLLLYYYYSTTTIEWVITKGHLQLLGESQHRVQDLDKYHQRHRDGRTKSGPS